jgi:hypothetical protein
MLGYLNEVSSWRNFSSNFDVSLTVHLSITLANGQLDAQIFNTRLRQNCLQFSLNLFTGRSLAESDDTRCCINTIWPPEDEQDIARNMYM